MIFLAQSNFSLLFTTLINLFWLSRFIVLYYSFSQKLSFKSECWLEFITYINWSPKKSFYVGFFCKNFLAFFNFSSKSWRMDLKVEGYLLTKVSGFVCGIYLKFFWAKDSRMLIFVTSLDRNVLGDSYVKPIDFLMVSSWIVGIDCRKHYSLAYTALLRRCFFINCAIKPTYWIYYAIKC